MTIQLRPEMEAIIEKQLQSGAFATPEDVIDRALAYLDAEEDWLSQNREGVAALVQEGWDQAEQGEFTDGDQIRAEMQRFKADWLIRLGRRHQAILHADWRRFNRFGHISLRIA